MSELVECPIEGCYYKCKPKGLAAHIRHKHPENDDTEINQPWNFLNETILKISKNMCLILCVVLTLFCFNQGLN